jgi:hypothetical protein
VRSPLHGPQNPIIHILQIVNSPIWGMMEPWV